MDPSIPHIVVLKGNARYSVYEGTNDNELDEYLDAFAKGDLQMKLVKVKTQHTASYDEDDLE